MRPLRPVLVALLAVLALGVHAPALPAQAPPRPRLPNGADVNDWEPYFDLGVRRLRGDPELADAAFFWSARLDPTRAEAPFARWVAFWLAKHDESQYTAYMRGDAKVLRSPDVARADSLRALALRRNPFVHQGLFLLIVDAMPGYYQEDVATQGWIAYANADLPKALSRFALALRRDPVKSSFLHYVRAASFVGLGALDSASVELDAYIRILRERDAKAARGMYESKAMLEYAQALLHENLGRPQAADEALGRAVVEDMSFAPAHVEIGRRALERGQADEAVRELGLALELDGADVIARLTLGDALLRQGKPTDALEQYRHAMEAEPWYAEGVYRYATALERCGRADDAAAAYARALELGARSWANGPRARARLAALRPGR